jgi:hypothetical protein
MSGLHSHGRATVARVVVLFALFSASLGAGLAYAQFDGCHYGCAAWRCFEWTDGFPYEFEYPCPYVFRMPISEITMGLTCQGTLVVRRRLDDGTLICASDVLAPGKWTGGCVGYGTYQNFNCCDRCDYPTSPSG